MAVYYKPQSPIQSGEDFIYPITTADQVKVDKDTRLNAVGVYLKNIDNSTDTTVYGNNATTLGGVAAEDYALKTDTAPDSSKLGGVAASDYALKTDTAPDSSKLGGKAPEYYIQPRNLLDNSDFTNPVNQRGQTSYSGSGYTIDRWIKESTSTVTVGDNGITIDNTNNSADEVFIQKTDGNKANSLVGKTLSIAVCDGNGTVYCGSSTVVNDTMCARVDGPNFYLGLNFFTEASSYQIARLVVYAGKSVTIKWIALYKGSYTSDTLPPYVPKGYAAELAECRLYYRPQQMYCLYCYSGGYAVGINFEPMRPGVIPTPVNAKAQTMIGDDIAGETNIVVTQIDRISYVANTNFTYGNYYRVFSEFSSDL